MKSTYYYSEYIKTEKHENLYLYMLNRKGIARFSGGTKMYFFYVALKKFRIRYEYTEKFPF